MYRVKYCRKLRDVCKRTPGNVGELINDENEKTRKQFITQIKISKTSLEKGRRSTKVPNDFLQHFWTLICRNFNITVLSKHPEIIERKHANGADKLYNPCQQWNINVT